MFRHWGHSRKLFGNELAVRDSWKFFAESLDHFGNHPLEKLQYRA